MSYIIYNKGEQVGNCTFIEEVYPEGKTLYKRYARFRCTCGNEFETEISSVKTGRTKTCGCLRISLLKKRIQKPANYYTKTPEYSHWRAMRNRCKENFWEKELYFDKNITVCERWNNPKKGFHNFLEDMGPRPSPNHSIDRIDGTKGYFPENCRWATTKEQAGNRSNNIQITYNGITQCLGHWAAEFKIPYSTLRARIKTGWDIEQALTTPPRQKAENRR